jgi:hypothetical protein
MVKVALVQFRLTQKGFWILALQAGGNHINLIASKASGSL